MQNLKNYVESMFNDFPNTDENLELKSNILDSMENKYEELISQGKTKEEALGTVILRFGDINELKNEYGITQSQNKDDKNYLPQELLQEYKNFTKNYSNFFALGVSLIILSITAPIILGDLGVILTLLLVAISVAIFIVLGSRGDKYEAIKEGKFFLSQIDRIEINDRYSSFAPKYGIAIAIGVALCIMSVLPLLIINLTPLNVDDDIGVVLLFVFISIAVFIFIRFGIISSYYEVLMRSDNEIEKLQEDDDCNSWIYNITMPLATFAFFLLGFLLDSWHISWIIIPMVASLTYAFIQIKKRIKE